MLDFNKIKLLRSYFKYIVCFLLAANSLYSVAQEEVDTLALDVLEMDEIAARPREYSLFSARVTGTVPHPVRNSAFKKTFIGIYELNAGLNLTFYKGFYAGAVFKNNLLKINSSFFSSNE